ncbi:peptidase inhibitor family I36 protein [Streptomyces sp. NPDC023838]|uniref:peptidase inhibitor family I36 protein n=1 Tax=Streptomyces sp. NPDC023838 TaxID=3154325 RepID=UPI0033DC5D24
MRSIRAALGAAATVLAALAVASPAVATETAPQPVVGVLSPAEEARVQQEAEKSEPVMANYKGKKINLAESWEGAQACTQVTGGAVYCFDSQQEADEALPSIDPVAAAENKKQAAQAGNRSGASTTDIGDCNRVCLFEHSNYTGRMLQWYQSGKKNLGDWGFRDKASSGCVRRATGGVLVYDARSFLPDPYMALGNPGCYDFTKVGYPTGGSWNDKADYIEM